MPKLIDYSRKLEHLRAERLRLESEHRKASKASDRLKFELGATKKALEVVHASVIFAQQEVKLFVEEIVTLALASVYGQDYSFEMVYDIKRGRSEVQFYVKKNGCQLDPKSEVGGGVMDVASFGLRLALWAISRPRPTPVFLYDEPTRFVSKDLSEQVADMIREVAKSLEVQVIMISHDEVLIGAADKAWRVEQRNGVSEVKEI